MNERATSYFRTVVKAYSNIHNLPFQGNEEYWKKRITGFGLMGDLHQIENAFMSAKEEIPVDTYLIFITRINKLKSIVKQKLAAIPSLEKEMPEVQKTVNVFEKMEKIAKDL